MSEWKKIKDYDYEVSNTGKVRSMDRCVINNCKYPKEPYTRIIFSQIMKIGDNGTGYKYVSLMKNHKRKNFYIHRLVALAFVNNPKNRKCVNHIDFNRANNDYHNLEWCSVQENVNHSLGNMRKPRVFTTKAATGYKYIYYRASKQLYRVVVYKCLEKQFKQLEDAIIYRDIIAKEKGIVINDK